MKTKIMKCFECDRYTLKNECDVCGTSTTMTCPPRFSPEDRYGKYRRMLKNEHRG